MGKHATYMYVLGGAVEQHIVTSAAYFVVAVFPTMYWQCPRHRMSLGLYVESELYIIVSCVQSKTREQGY